MAVTFSFNFMHVQNTTLSRLFLVLLPYNLSVAVQEKRAAIPKRRKLAKAVLVDRVR